MDECKSPAWLEEDNDLAAIKTFRQHMQLNGGFG